jgi:ribosomal protein S18 acetylase RimI-like enzyme
MPVSVRRIGSAEAVRSGSIIIQAYAEPPWEERWSIENATARLEELTGTPGYVGFAAVDGDALIGFVFALPHTTAHGSGLHISEIAILPQYQRMGIGSALLLQVEQEALKNNNRQIWLVSRRVGGVADYYSANGYHQSETLRVYIKRLHGEIAPQHS